MAVVWPQWAGAAVDRSGTPSGLIVSTNGDETVRFVAEERWRGAEIEQDLLAGDALRTGPAGALALRFVDQTLIRMHRNSALVVKQLPAAGAAQLELDAGRIWARADEAGHGVDVETPSATVAIRGTDWSLSVEQSGRTTLIVIDGRVVMSNAQGSITVNEGEAAVAEIGRAPAKVILANPPGREQLLYYASLRDAYGWLPLTALDNRAARERHAALRRIAPQRRSAPQWLELAETGFSISSRDDSVEALRQARAKGKLSRRDEARAKLIEAMLTAAHRDWGRAIELFHAAEPALSGEKRFAALFGRFLAYALAGRRQEAESLRPAIERYRGTRSYVLGQAWIRANVGDIEGALSDLAQAQKRHPDDTAIAVMAAQLSLVLARDKEARSLVKSALAADPDDPDALNTEALILSDYDWQLDLAEKRLARAIAAAPGHGDSWNTLGLVRSDQGDPGGAEEAYREAMLIDPGDPAPHVNYSILLLDADRPDQAKAELDRVAELDPAFSLSHLGKGRWLAQQGRMEEARDAFLDAVVANPGLSNAYLGLAIAHYQMGDRARAEQALENADALDDNDPTVSMVETAIALDHAQADRAITSAREAYRRYQARGSIDNVLAPTRDDGSYLNTAFAELSLTDWGRFYGDLTFNPFDAGSQFYQSAAPRAGVTESGSTAATDDLELGPVLQGLLLDPLAVSSRNRYSDLFRRPFLDTTLLGSGLFDRNEANGWSGFGQVEGYADLGLPVAFTIGAGNAQADRQVVDQTNDDLFGNVFVGTNLTLRDKLLLFGSYSRFDDDIPRATAVPADGRNALDAEGYAAGMGYSHSFGDRNVLMAAAMAAGTKVEADIDGMLLGLPFVINSVDKDDGLYGGLAHYFRSGALTLRYGAEAQTIDRETNSSSDVLGVPSAPETEEHHGIQSRLFGDVTLHLGKRWQVEAGLFLNDYDDDFNPGLSNIDPRVGVGFLAADGQWLRAAYREETELAMVASLAPVSTLGLTTGATPVEVGGKVRSLIARWDSEWSEHFFTAVEFEHQRINNFGGSLRDTLDPFGQLLADKGDIDRATFYANAWLGFGIGLFGQASLFHSDNYSGENRGEDLPLVPDWSARFGLSWVHPSQLRLTIAETLIGERAGLNSGTEVASAATTDISVSWQLFDKHLELGAAAFNVFDEDYELATNIPAPGATFVLHGAVRF